MGKEPIVWDMEKLAEKLGTTVEEVGTLKTIDWGWKELYPEHAEALGDLLSKAVNCVDLKMFVNEVGIDGGKAVGRALPYMTKLVQIDLQQWQIEPEGAKYLAAAVQSHPRIKSLKMHYNKLGWDGTEHIARACAQQGALRCRDVEEKKKGVSGPGSQGGMGMRRSAFLWTRCRCDAHGSVRRSALLWRRCRGARARAG